MGASVEETHLGGATPHDGRNCTCGANRTRPNYSDLHDVSSSVLGIFSGGCRAERRARASPRAGFGRRPAFSQSEGWNRAALIEISRMGNDAQLADESSSVEPYATSYREHFE